MIDQHLLEQDVSLALLEAEAENRKLMSGYTPGRRLTFDNKVAAFDALISLGEDPASWDPDTGEVWQYMGTVADHHQMRHRQHPVLRRRIDIALPASGKEA